MPPKARSWKGFERRVAIHLRHWWPDAKRGRQFMQGASHDRTEPDITGTGGVWVECSRMRDAGLDAVVTLAATKFAQACRDRAFCGSFDKRILIAISAGPTGALGMYGVEVCGERELVRLANLLHSHVATRVFAPVAGSGQLFGRWLVLARTGMDGDALIGWAATTQFSLVLAEQCEGPDE